MSVSIYAIMACAEHGHVRLGVASSTDPEKALWAEHCSRCHADLKEDKQ